MEASSVQVLFKTANDQQKNEEEDSKKENNNNTLSAMLEQPSPGLKANNRESHMRRTNKKTGVTSIGNIFGFSLSKAYLNDELFPHNEVIAAHSPYSTFDKHSFNTINNQLRGDSEYPE